MPLVLKSAPLPAGFQLLAPFPLPDRIFHRLWITNLKPLPFLADVTQGDARVRVSTGDPTHSLRQGDAIAVFGDTLDLDIAETE